MSYKAVCFDADGMIIKPGENFSDRLAKEKGIELTGMSDFFKGPFQKLKRGKGNLKDELELVMKGWGWNGTAEELIAFWMSGDVVDEDIRSLINQLKKQGVACYLTTNNEAVRGDYLRDGLGFGELFDHLFVSGKLGHAKPDKEYFELVWKQAQEDGATTKNDVLFCDDELEIVEEARAFGFDAYHYVGDFGAFKAYLAV